jgi:dTDP-4-dehydrorhamnose reductase
MNKRNAYVLGSNGMLGSMVVKHLSNQKCWNVHEYYRRSQQNALTEFLSEIDNNSENVVFNCIGGIPQKALKLEKLYDSNLNVVAQLIRYTAKNVIIVHPSTDCVFSGNKKGTYNTNDTEYSLDHYGISKRAAEALLLRRPNTLIIRTSIIGKGANDKGLLSWVMENSNKQINGYINHFWNGLTTLEWIKQALLHVDTVIGSNHQKLVQLGTNESHSKAELIMKISSIFGLKIDVIPLEKEFRSLVLESDYFIKPIDEQLMELKDCLMKE